MSICDMHIKNKFHKIYWVQILINVFSLYVTGEAFVSEKCNTIIQLIQVLYRSSVYKLEQDFQISKGTSI